jgi:type IV pilus assembly protein PilE
MKLVCTSPAAQPPLRGFTLIEVLVTLIIIGILAAMALPSFEASIRKGRRSDAFTSLSAVQQAQERWRGNNANYTSDFSAAPTGLGISSTTASGYYTITATAVSATGYTGLATAVSGTSQASDDNCKVMGVRMNGGNVVYGSGAASIDFDASSPDTGKCWAR